MPDVRHTALGKSATVECECGWRLWRERGFTKKQAYEAVRRHHYTECTDPSWLSVRRHMFGETPD